MPTTPISDFDESKDYQKLQVQKRQQIFAKDLNHVQDILENMATQGHVALGGWKLTPFRSDFTTGVITSSTSWPITHIRPHGLQNNGVYTFEAVDSTHIKWKYNDDAFSGSTEVVADGETWNINPGSCGFDFICHPDMAASDSVSYVATKAFRSSGGEIDGGTDEVTINSGFWVVNGVPVLLHTQTKSGIDDGDLVCLEVSETSVDYTSDSVLEHRLADGNLHPKAPEALQLEYEYKVYSISELPDDGTTTHVYVLGVCSVDGSDVTVTSVWDTPTTLAQLYEGMEGEGNKYPAAPSSINLSSLNEKSLSSDCLDSIEARTGLQVTVGAPSTWGCLTEDTKLAGWYWLHVEDTGTGASIETLVPAVEGVSKTPTVFQAMPTCKEVVVSARAVNALGLVSNPVTSIDYTIGGTCDITELPSVSLSKTNEGVLASIEYSTDQTDKVQGVSAFVAPGAYTPPGHEPVSMQENKLSGNAGQVDTILIPTDYDNPYITLEFFDYKGVYYTSNYQGNIDLTVSEIDRAGTAPAVDFALEREDEFRGFIIKNFSSVSGKAASLRVGICPDGSCPVTGNPWVTEVPSDVSSIRIPWDTADSNPLVKVYGVDEFGIAQTNKNSYTIDMTDCMISDGDSGPSFSVSIEEGGDFLTVSSIASYPTYAKGVAIEVTYTDNSGDKVFSGGRYSKEDLDTFNNQITFPVLQAETIKVAMRAYDYAGVLQAQESSQTLSSDALHMNSKVYLYNKNSSYTINDLISAIDDDDPGYATLLIQGGQYTEGISFPSGFDTNITICGEGLVVVTGDVSLTNVASSPGGNCYSFRYGGEFWTTRFENLEIHGQVIRGANNGSDVSWDVLFDKCTIYDDTGGRAPVEIAHDVSNSDYFNILFRDTEIGSATTPTHIIDFQVGAGRANCDVNFGFERCKLSGSSLDTSGIHITGDRSGEYGPAYIIGCEIQFWFTTATGKTAIAGDFDANGSILMAHNTIYTNAEDGVYNPANISVEVGDDLSGAANDTNTVIPYQFLNEAKA